MSGPKMKTITRRAETETRPRKDLGFDLYKRVFEVGYWGEYPIEERRTWTLLSESKA